jgi:hypothetical protein
MNIQCIRRLHHIYIQWNWKLQSYSNKATPHQYGATACGCGVNFVSYKFIIYSCNVLFLPCTFYLLLKANQLCILRLGYPISLYLQYVFAQMGHYQGLRYKMHNGSIVSLQTWLCKKKKIHILIFR